MDIKDTFLKAKIPDDLELIVKMEGKLTTLMNELCDDFKVDENGVMYL